MKPGYVYEVTIRDFMDGDTIKVDFDLGMGVSLQKQKVRLLGVDTPERGEEGYKDGSKKMEAMVGWWMPADGKITVRTYKTRTGSIKRGKYGRWLGVLYFNDLNINKWLVENGYAKVWGT